MSDRGEGGGGGGFGAFLFGVVLGAVAGFVFAPTERGETTRRKVTKGLRNLKDLAEEKVDEVRGLLKEAEGEAEAGGAWRSYVWRFEEETTTAAPATSETMPATVAHGVVRCSVAVALIPPRSIIVVWLSWPTRP